jgi:hypothetical protein
MPKSLVAVAMLILLSACQQMPVKDEESPYSRIPTGSSITLERKLPVPAGHSRVFLQYGEVVAKVKLEKYQPHCNFEVRQVSTGESVIEPDSFSVTALIEDEEEVVQQQAPRQLASLYSDLSLGGGDMVPLLSRFVRHTLHSTRQPDVMYLTCHGGFSEPWQVKTPGVSDIRQVLGDIATVKLGSTI